MSPDRGETLSVLHRLAQCWQAYVALVLTMVTLPALAGNFSISPIRLDFDNNTKNGAITISNDGDSELKVEISLSGWVQDANGKDVYSPSDELLYFPRLATIAPNSKQIIRVGLRSALIGEREKGYRLFVEELPEIKPLAGTQLIMRFGVPLFVKPLKEQPEAKIENISLEKGQLHVVVRNSGNVHLKIISVSADEGDYHFADQGGLYLLPTAKRDYRFAVPSEMCANLKKLNVVVKTDHLQLDGAFNITSSMCAAK